MNQALLGCGQIQHTRLRPKRHDFVYDTFFLMLPMRQLHLAQAQGGLAVNAPGKISFYDCDHGDGRGPEQGGALGWLDHLLQQEGIHDADGDIWLQTYPRMLGYTFKPVSFWYCHRADQSLRAIVVEVNNTFGERHCYLLENPVAGKEIQAQKCFHVSPFCRTDGRYRFRFIRSNHQGQDRVLVRVDHDDNDGPLLNTCVSGRLQTLTPALLDKVFWRYPAMTLMVMARIHWQALQLWSKRLKFYRKPELPSQTVTR